MELPESADAIGMQFKLIPSGKFMMGSPESEDGRADDEQQHEVNLTRDYYLGTTEVTQSQWETVMGTTPWKGMEKTRAGLSEGGANASTREYTLTTPTG